MIVLPFAKAETAQQAAESRRNNFEQCAKDDTLLLFLPNLQEVQWQREEEGEEGQTITHSCCWQKTVLPDDKAANGLKRISICKQTTGDEGETTSTETHWQLWQHGSAQLAIGLDGSGNLQPANYPPLRAYFATQETNPLPLLLHAHFPLDTGRDRIQYQAADNIPRYQQCIKDLAQVIVNALEDQTCATMLDCLNPKNDGWFDDNTVVASDLWEAVRKKALELTPSDARGLTLGELRLASEISIATWEAFKKWLYNHRKGGLAGLPFLPLGMEKEARQASLCALQTGQEKPTCLDKEALCELPLLPLEDKGDPDNPCRPDGPWVFFPPKPAKQKGDKGAQADSSLPKAPIPLKFLSIAASEALEGEDNEALKNFLNETLDVQLFALAGLITAMEAELKNSPTIAEKKPKTLLDFMQRVYRNATEDEKNSSTAENLSQLLRVNTHHKGWQPANTVYAGKDWDADNAVLEGMYPDKPFLAAPKDDKEREEKQRFYRWLRVGFIPRVFPFDEETMTSNQLMQWNKYAPQHPRPHNAYNIKNEKKLHLLDGGAKTLKTSGAFAYLAKHWDHFSCHQEAELKYSPRNAWHSHTYPSYLFWLMQNTLWVPVKEAKTPLLPYQVFQNSEITRELKGWVKTLDMTEADSRRYNDFLSKIGVRSGWGELTEGDWQGLASTSRRKTQCSRQAMRESSALKPYCVPC